MGMVERGLLRNIAGRARTTRPDVVYSVVRSDYKPKSNMLRCQLPTGLAVDLFEIRGIWHLMLAITPGDGVIPVAIRRGYSTDLPDYTLVPTVASRLVKDLAEMDAIAIAATDMKAQDEPDLAADVLYSYLVARGWAWQRLPRVDGSELIEVPGLSDSSDFVAFSFVDDSYCLVMSIDKLGPQTLHEIVAPTSTPPERVLVIASGLLRDAGKIFNAEFGHTHGSLFQTWAPYIAAISQVLNSGSS